jgi:serine/threonine-protein kinase
VLAGRYRIIGLLGRGGMGEVYRADDLELGQAVSLKFLPRSLAETPGALERFRAEVRNARQISHPNVCRVYDIGEIQGLHFLTMEFVDGEDLATLLRRIGRLPASKANEVGSQLCTGIAAAHDKGVLHRDLKPANIMIGPFGQLLVLDWGLARPGSDPGRGLTQRSDPGRPVTHSGTEGYVAPEQARGILDARSDVYALGAILDGLTGDSGSRLLRPLRSVIDRAREPEPEARYQDVASLAADVRRFVDGAAVTAHRENLLERTRRVAWAYRTPIALVLAYLAMRGLLLFWRA